MNYDKIVQVIMDIGESLLCTGAEIYRVQDSIDRMCASYGFLRQDVFVIQNNIQITVETKEHEMITQIRHVETTGFNYDRLDALNGLSRYICTNRPDDEELQKRYREIMDAPTQKAWIIVLAQIVGGTSFAVFFGCNFGDALIALVLSVFIVFFGKWLEKREENLLIYNLILSFLSEVFVVLAFRAGITGHPDWIMIGVVMLLVSSLGLINGIRDVMQANFISGFLEIMNSLLGAFGIAFGIALAMMLMKWNGTDHFVINPSVWIQIVSCTIGCIGYASWFGIRGKRMVYSGIGAFITWGIYLLAFACNGNNFYSVIISSCFVAAYAYMMSRLMKSPSTLFLTGSVFPLMPGARLYYMMAGMVAGKYAIAFEHLTVIAETCIGIAFGFWIIDIVVRNIRKTGKKLQTGHSLYIGLNDSRKCRKRLR